MKTMIRRGWDCVCRHVWFVWHLPEIIRLIDALQINAAKKVATPEGWKPGDKVIVPPPATTQAAEERMKATDMEVVDWYFSKKSV